MLATTAATAFVISSPDGVLATGSINSSNTPPAASEGLAVVQTDPTSGAVLTQSPTALTLTFNTAFDPFSLGSAAVDFELDQVNADGTTTPVDSSLLNEPDDLSAPTDTLVLPLSASLPAGEYQLTLLGTSWIAEPDGTPLIYGGVNQVLTDFTIQPPGAATTTPGTPPASAGLAVVQTDPASGAVLTQSPTALTLTFNTAFDPFSLSSAAVDFELDQVNADGTTTPVDSSFLNEPDDLFAPTDTLVLSLSEALPAGEYQLTLLGTSGIAEPDGTPLIYGGVNQVLTDFTIQPVGAVSSNHPQGVSLSAATDLGVVGSTTIVTAGTLDFLSNPFAVSLDQVTLAPGHFWRLGAAISSFRDGGTLMTDLTLFNAQGQVIKTSTTGPSDFPEDPYLFAGLAPGTYYIGVSDIGNIPGQPGGYDPATRTPGTVPATQPSGSFQLSLVANPISTPTQLLGFELNRADPLSSTPTGFTLAFNGPLDPTTLVGTTGTIYTGLEVVDQSGKVWGVAPLSLDEATAQYTFLFNDHLPAGTYRLVVPAQGGITDLAGLTPVAPGEPAGVLATWKVAATAPPANPNDLGALLPGTGMITPDQPVVIDHGAVTLRFVVTYPGTYTLDETSTGGPLALVRDGPDGVVTLTPGLPGQNTTILMDLTPGIYALEMIATGSEPVSVSYWLSVPKISADSFSGSSGPALNLTLIAPATSGFNSNASGASSGADPFSASSTSTTAAPASSTPTSIGSTTTGSDAASASASAHVSTAVTGLLVTLGNSLVGLPNEEAAHIGAVGPGTETGTTALALNSPGLLQGISYGFTTTGQAMSTGDVVTPGATEPITTEGALVDTTVQRAARDLDEYALADSEWLSQVVNTVARWFRPSLADDPVPNLEETPELIALMRDDLSRESGRVEEAQIGSPLGIVFVSAMAVRLQYPVRRWVGRFRRNDASRKYVATRGPHIRF